MKRWSEIKKSAAKRLAMAPEAAGCMRLTVVDNTALFLENYQSIVEYTQKSVRIRIGEYDLLVRGADLELKDFGSDIVSIRGQIKSVEYEGLGR